MANKKLSALITIGGAVSGTLMNSLDKTKTKIDSVGNALKNLEGRQKMLGQAIQTFGQQGKNVDGMRSRYQLLTKQIDQLRAANERLLQIEKQRTANHERQSQLRQKIGETAMVGAAIALPTVALFSKAAQFNYDLQVIGNTADLTQGQIRALGAELLVMSDRTGQSAETLKNAVGFLVAAGQDVGTAQANMMAIGRTATATAAAVEDVAKATFVMGDALKVSPDKMQKALDILVQSGKEGNFEFKAMAAELPTLAASFQALKLTGTEAVATMGAALQIARKGAANEAEAANNMANFLAKILSPETLKKAEALGSNLYGVISGAQAKGKNPIEAAIKEINKITKGGDQKLLGELFGDMQVQNFVRPMLQNLQEYERIKAKALSADGVTDRDFEKMLATSKQQVDELKNSFAGLGKTIGDAVEPVFGKLATALTPVVRAARDYVAANPALVGGIIVAAGAFTTLRLALLSTQLAYKMLGGGVLDLAANFAKQRTAALAAAAGNTVAGTSASVGFAAMVTGIRAVGIALVTTPIGAIVAGIAAGAALIYKHWDGVAAFFGGVGQGIMSGLQPVVQVFRDLYDSLGVLKPAFDLVGSALSTAWSWFTNLLQPVQYSSDELTKAGAAGKSFGEALAYGINLVLTPLQLLIQGITWVNNNIGAALAQVNQFGAAVGGKAFDAVQKVKGWFGSEDTAAPAAVPGTSAAVPALPPMATARNGGTAVTDSSQNTFNIYQQPGQDSRKLAEEIARQQEQRRKVLERGTLFDGAMAQ